MLTLNTISSSAEFGIRPGERLHEILFACEEPTAPIGIDGIAAAQPISPSIEAMRGWLGAGPRARRTLGDLRHPARHNAESSQSGRLHCSSLTCASWASPGRWWKGSRG